MTRSLLWRHLSNSKLKFERIFIRRWHGHCFDVILISKFEFSLIRRWRGYFFDVILILKLKFSEMTFCYRMVPTTIGKVELCCDLTSTIAKPPYGPAHQTIAALVSIWCGRGILIQCSDVTLGYWNIQFLWHKMLKRPRQKIKEIAVYFHNKI